MGGGPARPAPDAFPDGYDLGGVYGPDGRGGSARNYTMDRGCARAVCDPLRARCGNRPALPGLRALCAYRIPVIHHARVQAFIIAGSSLGGAVSPILFS